MKKKRSLHAANFYFSGALQNPRYWENQLRQCAVQRTWDETGGEPWPSFRYSSAEMRIFTGLRENKRVQMWEELEASRSRGGELVLFIIFTSRQPSWLLDLSMECQFTHLRKGSHLGVQLYYKWKTWSACHVGSLSAVRAALHENDDSQPVIWNNLYWMFIQRTRVGEATWQPQLAELH